MRYFAKAFRKPEILVLMAFVISFVAISIALVLEHVGGYHPCELCYEGRISHYVGIPLLLLTLSWGASPYRWMLPMTIFSIIIYGYGALISVYHAGAEWKYWDGPTTCGSLILKSGLDATDLLLAIQNTRMVSCTEPAFRILGISLAGLNAIICVSVVVLLLLSLFPAVSGKNFSNTYK